MLVITPAYPCAQHAMATKWGTTGRHVSVPPLRYDLANSLTYTVCFCAALKLVRRSCGGVIVAVTVHFDPCCCCSVHVWRRRRR